MFDPIQDFILDYDDLKKFLIENNQFSLENNFGHHMRKVLLLSCASYFETEIQELIKTFVEQQSSDDRVLSFVQNKAITRQYHTYFNWDGNNVNSFLAMFGNDFKNETQRKIADNEELKMQMKAFLEIGNERNKMVHENFLSYKLEKTFEEIVELYNKGEQFVLFLKKCFGIDDQ